jgi:hypothetical protein
MAITFNPLTGNFDEVGVPITVDTVTPVLSTNGDIHAYFDGSNAYIYWKSNGNVYQKVAIAG